MSLAVALWWKPEKVKILNLSLQILRMPLRWLFDLEDCVVRIARYIWSTFLVSFVSDLHYDIVDLDMRRSETKS